MKKLYDWIINWFEHGDLVPLIVIVSAVHYTVILAHHDHIIVAVAIGLLVDLGHYRWVRAAVRYSGADWREKIVRWGMAAGMTAVSIAYQQRYYADWWLSIPLPALIASLAWLGHVDRAASARKPAQVAPQVRIEHDALPQPDASHALPTPAQIFVCELCGAEFAKQQGLAAHARKHTRKDAAIPVQLREDAELTNGNHKT